MNKREVFAELARRGATRAEVRFSGGNDEGGADSIVLYNGETEVGDIVLSYAGPGDPFAEILQQPIDDHWGGFAGDYSVSGTLTWDVTNETASLVYEETEYVHHEEEVKL